VLEDFFFITVHMKKLNPLIYIPVFCRAYHAFNISVKVLWKIFQFKKTNTWDHSVILLSNHCLVTNSRSDSYAV